MPGTRASLPITKASQLLELDSPFDRLTNLACSIFGLPHAMISIIDGERTVFRSNVGLGQDELPRDMTLTNHIVSLGPDALVMVEDGQADPRTCDHVMVNGPPYLRFFAGVAVVDRDNQPIGAIGVMDVRPRKPLTARQVETLKMLGQMAADLFQQADATRAQREQVALVKLAEEVAGVGHWRVDLTTGETTASDEVVRIHGVQPGSAQAANVDMYAQYDPEDLERLQGLLARAAETGEGYETTIRLRRLDDGARRLTRARARVQRDENGRPRVIFGVFQDITDATEAEQRLKDSEAALSREVATLSLAQGVAGLGVWRLDLATGKVAWSDEVYRIHGVDRASFDPSYDDAVGFYHAEDQPRVKAWIEQAVQGGEPGEFRLRIIRADGEERVVLSRCRREHDANGALIGLVGVFQDVTERERAHEIVAASEARFRTLADHASDVIAIFNLDGVFRYLSPATRRVMGWAPEDLIGMRSWDLVHTDDQQAMRAAYRDHLAAGPDAPSPRIRYRGRRRDGSWAWLEAQPTVLRDRSGAPIEIQDSVRDISAAKALEEALTEARDAAEAAARAKGDFLANMSHELRTPLTSVIGYSGLLKDREGLGPTERLFADRIATSSQALLSVINDILDYSKLEAGAIELEAAPFDPGELATRALSIVEPQAAAKGLALDWRLGDGTPQALCGDEARLGQVLLNFLSNAVKFTEAGEVRIEGGWSDGRLRLEVIDSGEGIDPAKIDRLFERFTQADSSTTRLHGGTGLGLAICKRLIELMGGTIGARSTPGEGSVFWFEVPAQEADAAMTLSDPAASEALDVVGLRVLMADDNAGNRELFRVMSAAWGIELETASDGLEALERAKDGGLDLILMDLHMPVMDGMDATRAIRQLEGAAGQAPIIALSADVQPEQMAVCHAIGMDGHVAKPINVETLLREMSRVVQAGRAAPEYAL